MLSFTHYLHHYYRDLNKSIDKLNSKGKISSPCFTPFDMEKIADVSSPFSHGIIGYYTCNI